MSGKIERLLDRHNAERLNAINLIVSENRMSERAIAPLSSDIQSRYAASFYAGTGPAQEITLHQQAGCKTAIDSFRYRYSLGKRAVSM